MSIFESKKARRQRELREGAVAVGTGALGTVLGFLIVEVANKAISAAVEAVAARKAKGEESEKSGSEPEASPVVAG